MGIYGPYLFSNKRLETIDQGGRSQEEYQIEMEESSALALGKLFPAFTTPDATNVCTSYSIRFCYRSSCFAIGRPLSNFSYLLRVQFGVDGALPVLHEARRKSMLRVFAESHVLKVFVPVVKLVSILMIDWVSFLRRWGTNKSGCYKPVNSEVTWLSALKQPHLVVSLVNLGADVSITGSFCREFTASLPCCDATDATKAANFVQTLVAEDRFPDFFAWYNRLSHAVHAPYVNGFGEVWEGVSAPSQTVSIIPQVQA